MAARAIAAATTVAGLLLPAHFASARTTMADHCTGFCVAVYNGTSKGIWMRGDVGQRWVPPHTWSNRAHPEMKDVDRVEVPYGCDLTYQLRRYHYGQSIRIHGWSPVVWIHGVGC